MTEKSFNKKTKLKESLTLSLKMTGSVVNYYVDKWTGQIFQDFTQNAPCWFTVHWLVNAHCTIDKIKRKFGDKGTRN